MMKWILIAWMSVSGGNSYTVDFNTKEACEAARKAVAAVHDTHYTVCVPKGIF